MAVVYIASDKARAGKTALSVTIARKLSQEGKQVALFKPFHQPARDGEADHDGTILRDALDNTRSPAAAWPMTVDPTDDDAGFSVTDALAGFQAATVGAEVSIVEGISGFTGVPGAASQQLAESLDAKVVAVMGYTPELGVEDVVLARELFGERLAGVVVNGVTRYKRREVQNVLGQRVLARGVKVLAVIPEDRRLLGVSVDQLVQHLDGSFLNWEEKGSNLVEHLLVGGMLLDWGVLYFERFANKAVIVRGDRPDLQMAALGTPTSCIVMTGGHSPIEYIRHESRETGVPLIQVQSDTLATTEALNSIQSRAEFDHPLKCERFLDQLTRSGAWDALRLALGL